MFDIEVFVNLSDENILNDEKFFSINKNNLLFFEKEENTTLLSENNDKNKNSEFKIAMELYGKIKFYKKNHENISLTNPQQNFRYLPINRKNVVIKILKSYEIILLNTFYY